MKVLSILGFLALAGCATGPDSADDGLGVDASVKTTVGEICDGEDNDADGSIDEDCGQCDLLVTRNRAWWGTATSCVITGGATGTTLLPIVKGTTSLNTYMQVHAALIAAAATNTAKLGREVVAGRLNEAAFFLTDLPYDDVNGDGTNETVGEILDLANTAYSSGTALDKTKYLNLLTTLNSDGSAFSLWFDSTCVADPEVCNWVDDDGDGMIDDNCACDPSVDAPTFENDIQPIFDANCISCHVGSAAPHGLDLSDGLSYDLLVNVPAGELATMDRIEPGDAAHSYLVLKILGTHHAAGGTGQRMPLGGPYLDTATIGLIQGWVADGALDE